MSLSMSKASSAVFVQILKGLHGVLDKAAAHAEAHKIDPAALLVQAPGPQDIGSAISYGRRYCLTEAERRSPSLVRARNACAASPERA